MGKSICVYSTKSMAAMAIRKPSQTQAAIRRKRVESFGECISESYHEGNDVHCVCRHDFFIVPMTGVMGGLRRFMDLCIK